MEAKDCIETKPLSFIEDQHEWRSVNPDYVDQLVEKIKRIGLKPKPLEVTPDGTLYGGRHRLRAFRRLGIDKVPMHIEAQESLDRAAKESNEADSEALPETFVDHAEAIWRKLEDATQQQVADDLDISRSQVANYSRLQRISAEAWEIVTTKVREEVSRSVQVVTENVTVVTFSETLLREIVPLTPEQQVELVGGLANRGMQKSTFRQRAETYRTRNEVKAHVQETLADVDEDIRSRLTERVEDGDFDSAWDDGPTRKLEKATDHALRLQRDRQQFTLHLSPVEEADTVVEADSVDWIITDPPYPEEYLDTFTQLSEFASHALRPGGSCLVMSGQTYVPEVVKRLSTSLKYHWTAAYLTPGGQAVQQFERNVNTFWKPIFWFLNPPFDGDEWVGDVVESDVNDNDKRFHQWGQSISGMLDLVDRFTTPGDVVCDPFVGGGATGAAALECDCQFVGLDIEEECIETTDSRLTKLSSHA